MYLQILRKYWPILISVIVTLALSWQLWKPELPVPEVSKPEVKQDDGSIIVEKKPDAAAKTTVKIPKKSTVERIIKFTVQAKTPVSTITGKVEVTERATQEVMSKASMQDTSPEATLICPPVDVEMVLVRNEDETRSVIIKSDGTIINALDIPVEAAKRIESQPVWAVGAVIDPFKQTFGAFVDRDLGFARLGLQLNQRSQGDIPNEVWVKAGIRF